MQDESPEVARPRNLMWVARYEGRLVYIPHENIEMIISNLDYNGNPMPRVPIRIMRMTRENEATYFDLDPTIETMNDLVARVIDIGRIVDYNEDLRARQMLITQARMAQQGAQEPAPAGPQSVMPEQPVSRGDRTKSAFPDPVPPSREEQAVAEAESWDQEGAVRGQVTDEAAQALIEEVIPPVVAPKAGNVRRGRNGNRRA